MHVMPLRQRSRGSHAPMTTCQMKIECVIYSHRRSIVIGIANAVAADRWINVTKIGWVCAGNCNEKLHGCVALGHSFVQCKRYSRPVAFNNSSAACFVNVCECVHRASVRVCVRTRIFLFSLVFSIANTHKSYKYKKERYTRTYNVLAQRIIFIYCVSISRFVSAFACAPMFGGI